MIAGEIANRMGDGPKFPEAGHNHRREVEA
jgi:hypothetical protein